MNSPFPIAQNFAYLLCAIMAAGFLCVLLLWLAPLAHRLSRRDTQTTPSSTGRGKGEGVPRIAFATAESICIDCGSRAEAEPLTTQNHEAWRALICRNCGCQWVQVFHIARLETIESEVIDPREVEIRRARALKASIAKALKHTQKL